MRGRDGVETKEERVGGEEGALLRRRRNVLGERWGTGWIFNIDLFDAPEAILGALLL